MAIFTPCWQLHSELMLLYCIHPILTIAFHTGRSKHLQNILLIFSLKWTVIEGLHLEDIKHHPERISHYNWKGLKIPVSIKNIDKFEKKNPSIAVNVLLSNKKNKNKYTARRSERNVKCKKQAHLLMIVDGEKRHYTAIKSISWLSSKLNEKARCIYHFCMNCLNGFPTESVRDMHYELCSSNDHVKVNMPTKKDKMAKISRWTVSV